MSAPDIAIMRPMSYPRLRRILRGSSITGCSFLASRARPTAPLTALAAAMPMSEPVPVYETLSPPTGENTAMESDVVPVSLYPRSASAADLASTRGMRMLTLPSSVRGSGDMTAMFIVPARWAALRSDTTLRSG